MTSKLDNWPLKQSLQELKMLEQLIIAARNSDESKAKEIVHSLISDRLHIEKKLQYLSSNKNNLAEAKPVIKPRTPFSHIRGE